MTLNGLGTVSVGSGNTYLGGTVLNAGTLVGAAAAAGGTPFGSGIATLNEGTLQVNGLSTSASAASTP